MIVPDPNPLLGATIHTFGGVSASTCYVPFEKVKQWTWETYWLVFSVSAWLITPLIVGFLTVPELLAVLSESPAHVKWKAFLLGAVYGFGGMSFGYAILIMALVVLLVSFAIMTWGSVRAEQSEKAKMEISR